MRVGVTLAGLVMVLVLAGCGNDPSAEEKYVEAHCETTLRYAESLLAIFADMDATPVRQGPKAIQELRGWNKGALILARNLREELATLPVPSTEAGRRAANYADSFPGFAIRHLLDAEQRVRELPDSPNLMQSKRGRRAFALALTDAFILMTGAEVAFRKELPTYGVHFDTVESCLELDTLGQD